MSLYKNRYRIESSRLSKHNYGSAGYYFLTICTHKKQHLFGIIENDKMQYSKLGKIVNDEWNTSFEIRDELSCDCFVIMPNHIHGIVVLNNNHPESPSTVNPQTVETQGLASLQQSGVSWQQSGVSGQQSGVSGNVVTMNNCGIAYRTPRSISSFVGGFKSGATKTINKYLKSPGRQIWQPRFHDHIIRNADDYYRIRQYILENPMNWYNDRFRNHV